MRTAEELIDEIKFTANINDDSRYDDARLLKFLNSAQRHIQKLIFSANPKSDFMASTETITLSGATEHDLPSDIFAYSAISNVQPISASGSLYKPLRNVTMKERDKEVGYYILDGKIKLSPANISASYAKLEITYIKRLPDLEAVCDTPALPAACEEFLMLYVERKIAYTDSSSDVSSTISFTEDEKAELLGVFKKTSNDIKYPVISDETYYNY